MMLSHEQRTRHPFITAHLLLLITATQPQMKTP